MAARVGVPRVHRVRERRRGAKARFAVGPLGELVELCDVDRVGMEEARPTLAGILRLVEGLVRCLDEVTPVRRVPGVGRDAG
jgi:hypothetical protein